MRDVHQKTAALEELLSRVQQKRAGLAAQRTGSQEALSPPPPPQALPKVAPSPSPSVAEWKPPAPAVKLPAPPPAVKLPAPHLDPPPRPSLPRPAPVESRIFESSAMASGGVAHVEGEIISDWSLRAVLSRAFRLTP
jgi:hypothetical protein